MMLANSFKLRVSLVESKAECVYSMWMWKWFFFIITSGTVLRATQAKFLEYKTDYICGHCKATITIEGEYGKHYVAAAPSKCPNGCKGRPYSDTTNIVNENFITYQEIKIMVNFRCLIHAMVNQLTRNMITGSCVQEEHTIGDGCYAGRWFGRKLPTRR